MADDLQ